MTARLDAHCCVAESTDVAPPERIPADAATADEELSAFGKALAHPVRLHILKMLASRERRMCAEIVGELPLAQSTVSEHLRVLRAAGLVATREDGIRTEYCLDDRAVTRLKTLLERVLPTRTGVRDRP